MALILLIESSTEVCSVAIARDGELLAIRESCEGRDHASRVALYASELFEELSIEPSSLDCVAVGAGPGSYTGLRIGVSFAKGLCYALSKPLLAITTTQMLSALAIERYASHFEGWERVRLAPMIDARRMEVYTQLFSSDGELLSPISAEIIDSDSLAEWRDEGSCDGKSPLLIFGDGAEKCAETLPWAQYIEVEASAKGLIAHAERLFAEEKWEDVAYYEPLYLKDFIVTTSKKKVF